MAFHFRLPVITDLTIEQQAVLNETNAIAVSGGPGTGKSVVSLWRHIQNHDMGRRNSLLLTYTVSLESYLASSAMSENENAGNNVNRTYKWLTEVATNNYDEIIIDEAQDVRQEKYAEISHLTPMVSYSADDNQILYPNRCTKENQLRDIFKNPHFTLRENHRNTKEVVRFVRSMFPASIISQGKLNGPKPQLVCSGGIQGVQNKIILDVIQTFKSSKHNIGILLPLETHVRYWFNELQNEGINCSKYSNKDKEINLIENIHVTTFKSSKGLEFDTVIIPNFNMYEEFIRVYDVVETNDFYVVLTRSRRNLILIDSSTLKNGTTSTSFIQDQISKNIVELELKYVEGNI
jgi:superfamily I DNA/RNA helicase